MATLGATTISTHAAGHAGNQQVVSTDSKSNNDFSLASTTITELTISRITITPSVATSRILIVYAMQMHINQLSYSGARGAHLDIHKYVGSTDTDLGPICSIRVHCQSDDYTDHSGLICHIDHPNTTSAVRYSLYANNYDSGLVYWQHAYAGTHGLRAYARELTSTTTNWNPF